MRLFEPRSECVEDIVKHTRPADKHVLSVAAYGYPFVFLAEGAQNVVAFDIDSEAVGWNHFLRAATLALEHEESLKLLERKVSRKPSAELIDMCERIAQFLPEKWAAQAMVSANYYEMIHGVYKNATKRIFPHVKDKETYEFVRCKIRSGGLEIRNMELLDFMEQLNAEGKRFDVIYASSIRNWVLLKKFDSDERAFERMYDIPLGRCVFDVLSKGGVFYEALIFDPKMPARRTDSTNYRGLQREEHPSIYPESNSAIALGIKPARETEKVQQAQPAMPTGH